MQQPGECELHRRAADVGGDLAHPSDEPQVGLEVVALEARLVAAEVVRGEIVDGRVGAGQEAPADGAVGHDSDAEGAGRRDDLSLDAAREERPLALQRRDRVHGAGGAQRVGADLAEADVPDLSLRDEFGQPAHGVLDRHVGIAAMHVVEVDVVDAEALQR